MLFFLDPPHGLKRAKCQSKGSRCSPQFLGKILTATGLLRCMSSAPSIIIIAAAAIASPIVNTNSLFSVAAIVVFVACFLDWVGVVFHVLLPSSPTTHEKFIFPNRVTCSRSDKENKTRWKMGSSWGFTIQSLEYSVEPVLVITGLLSAPGLTGLTDSSIQNKDFSQPFSSRLSS